MKLGVQLGYWMGATPPPHQLETVLEAERLGFDSAWFAEAYGSDCFSPLCWIGSRTSRVKLGTAGMQISARTPPCTPMTAATIDHLPGGPPIPGGGGSRPPGGGG